MIEWQQIMAIVAFVGLIVFAVEEYIHRKRSEITEKDLDELLGDIREQEKHKHD